MSAEITIPNKSLFKLDEVCSLTGVKPYVLRFWESEFQQITPIVSSTGQKNFEHSDIEAIILVKELLFEKKMTIENAKFELDKIYNLNAQEEDEELLLANAKIKIPQLKMELNSRELENLKEAKILLSSMIESTELIQSQNNWI